MLLKAIKPRREFKQLVYELCGLTAEEIAIVESQ